MTPEWLKGCGLLPDDKEIFYEGVFRVVDLRDESELSSVNFEDYEEITALCYNVETKEVSIEVRIMNEEKEIVSLGKYEDAMRFKTLCKALGVWPCAQD